MYRIRNFGNDTRCESLTSLREALTTRYRGMSVSIEYPRPSGFMGIAFVDVTVDGEICESYGTQRPFDFTSIAA